MLSEPRFNPAHNVLYFVLPWGIQVIVWVSIPTQSLCSFIFLPCCPPDISQHPELKDICEAEHHLCEAQADDSLADVCCLCHIIQYLWQFKKPNVSGTGN